MPGQMGPPVPMIEDFLMHVQSVSNIFSSQSCRELMQNFSIALKKVFKCTRVNFMLQDHETIDILRKEGASTKPLNYQHVQYYLLIPDAAQKATYTFNPGFRNLPDVIKGNVFTGRVAVSPVYRQQAGANDSPVMLVQMNHWGKGNTNCFEANRDKKAFDAVSQIASGIL